MGGSAGSKSSRCGHSRSMASNSAERSPGRSSTTQSSTPSRGKPSATASSGNGRGRFSYEDDSVDGSPARGALAAKKSGRGLGVSPGSTSAAAAGHPGGGRSESPGSAWTSGQPAYGSGGGGGSSSNARLSRMSRTSASRASVGRPPKATRSWNGRSAARNVVEKLGPRKHETPSSRSLRSSAKLRGFGGNRSRFTSDHGSPRVGRYSSSQMNAPPAGMSSRA